MKVWIVRYTSLMATPCLMTLSRSTLTNCCGTLGRKVVRQAADLRPFARRGHEFLQIVREKLHVAARAVLQDKGEAARSADAGNRRGREAEGHRARELC